MTLTCCQDHILTENIWFVWSETSYSGDKRRCHYALCIVCGTDDDNKQLKIELLSQWKLEAEFRNLRVFNTVLCANWSGVSQKKKAPFIATIVVIILNALHTHCFASAYRCGDPHMVTGKVRQEQLFRPSDQVAVPCPPISHHDLSCATVQCSLSIYTAECTVPLCKMYIVAHFKDFVHIGFFNSTSRLVLSQVNISTSAVLCEIVQLV